MDHKKIILDAISAAPARSSREIQLYENIILGYEEAKKFYYTPEEYLRGCRQANINLLYEFQKVWADHYDFIPGTPHFKKFSWDISEISPYRQWLGYIDLNDFQIIRRSINMAHHKLIGNKQTLNVLTNKEIKNKILPFNTELFPSIEAWRFFKDIEPEIVKPNKETVGYSFIYRQMVNDGFIFNRVRHSDYIDFISDEYGYTLTKIKTLQEISLDTREGYIKKYNDRMMLLELIPPNKHK